MDRYKRVNACKECGYECDDRSRCTPARVERMRKYSGVRFTSDGFDCALPVAIDSHSHCSYGCLYCFSDNLVAHRTATSKPVGQTSLGEIERIFAGEGGKSGAMFRKALRYDLKDQFNGYPCPVQLGALNDPCDHIERQQGWLLDFIDIAIKYNQPVRVSTKGTILAVPEYLAALEKAPHLFWVAFSIITPDDDLLAKVDRRAPSATARLATMAALSTIGVRTSLRFRPIMPGISDSTPDYPYAWRTLIRKAAEAGARAISYEVAFVPGAQPKPVKDRWVQLARHANIDYMDLYKRFGPIQSCMRPPYGWTEEIMHAIAHEAHQNEMTVGISDPVWKQLNDTGCCCGMLPDDPVFGNWERESATNQLLEAKRTGKEIGPDDVTPAWAYETRSSQLYYQGAGPTTVYTKRHEYWSDKIRMDWNNMGSERGPLNYFQGALVPSRRDNGDVYFRYRGLEPTGKPAAVWKVGYYK